MKLFADYHTHTKYSDGRGTLEENVLAAREKGLREIAITDHGPNNIGTGVKSGQTYLEIKKEAKEVAEKYGDIKVLVGSEADIISLDGNIDLSKEIIKELDLLIVGLHPFALPETIEDGWHLLAENRLAKINKSFEEKARNNNTKALIDSMHKYDIDIISHPNLGMKVNIDELAAACACHEVAFEINTGHDYITLEEVKEVAAQGANFAIDSDAHFPETVGQLDKGLALAIHAGLTVERIINAE